MIRPIGSSAPLQHVVVRLEVLRPVKGFFVQSSRTKMSEVGDFSELQQRALDRRASVSARMRSLFGLKELVRGGDLGAVHAMGRVLCEDSSALVRHEAAYVMGQSQQAACVPILLHCLERADDEEPVVRHEAAEALAAIGADGVETMLERFEDDKSVEVRETVAVALRELRRRRKRAVDDSVEERSVFYTVDPAPPMRPEGASVSQLGATLMNAQLPLYERYGAMFALRNCRDDGAVDALCRGFADNSALFKHEIAYVLGQLQSPRSVPALTEVLRDEAEHPMVRHEAAEALGAVGGEVVGHTLRGFLDDGADLVRESCEVALDISDYNRSEQLHYTDYLAT